MPQPQRFDLEKLFAALEPQTVNREGKRDREDVVEVPGMARGMTREALGQAMLLGYGDDIEGYLTSRHPDDIKRERYAFSDEHRLAANAAYGAGLLTGGAVPRIIKAMAGAPKQQLDEMPPRVEPDLRQAMRNADQAAPADESAAQMRAQLEMLLNTKLPPRPEYFPGAFGAQSGNEIPQGGGPGGGPGPASAPGGENNIPPSDIFAALAGSPQSAVPLRSPEEQALQALSPTDAVKFGQQLEQATPVSAEQRAQNLRTTGWDALSATPGPGNLIAAHDSVEGSKRAYDEFSQGNLKRGGIEAALAALSGVGAVTGLPTSRLAGKVAEAGKDSVNVFLPLPGGSRMADDVLDMRESGRPLRDIYTGTGHFIGPDGTVRGEVIDSTMRINPNAAKAGTETRLGDLVDHPELFERRPKYRDIPVTLTDKVQGENPVARTLEGGRFENSVEGDMRQGLAKNLQYTIAREGQLPASVRHGPEAIPNDITAAIKSLADVPVESHADRKAMAAYIEHLAGVRGDYRQSMSLVDERRQFKIEKNTARRSAGNADSRIVNARAAYDPDKVRDVYPYAMSPPYFQRKPGRGVPPFEEMWALPPEGASGDDLMEFIRSWHQYGSGRKTGGK